MQEQRQQETQQHFLGMPMNWEWNPGKMLRNYWNPDDERIFPPKVFGIGWDVNGHALLRRFGLTSNGREEDQQ
jgi:hypothetical protein